MKRSLIWCGSVLGALVLVSPALSTPAIALGSTPMAAAEPSAGGTILFQDQFTNPNDPNWTFFNRNGIVTGGRLWVNGSYMNGSVGRDGWALTNVGNAAWTNYSFSITYGTWNRGGSPNTVHMGTVYLRVASESGNVRESMYRIDVWDPGQPVPAPGPCGTGVLARGAVGLAKYADGVVTSLKTVCLSNSAVGTNRLKVTVNGASIRVVVNGFRVLSYTDPSPIPSGGVGVGQIWETNGWFDNAVVRTVG